MPVNIRAILREEDIEGLIALGAPEDEYDFEGQEIELAVSRLDKRDEDDLVHVIEKVWRKFFELGAEDIALRRDAFRRAARRILTGTQRGGQV